MTRYFKTIFTTLMPFMLGLLGAYLVGSFINVALNPELWTVDSRVFMSIAGMVFGLMLYARLNLEGLA